MPPDRNGLLPQRGGDLLLHAERSLIIKGVRVSFPERANGTFHAFASVHAAASGRKSAAADLASSRNINKGKTHASPYDTRRFRLASSGRALSGTCSGPAAFMNNRKKNKSPCVHSVGIKARFGALADTPRPGRKSGRQIVRRGSSAAGRQTIGDAPAPAGNGNAAALRSGGTAVFWKPFTPRGPAGNFRPSNPATRSCGCSKKAFLRFPPTCGLPRCRHRFPVRHHPVTKPLDEVGEASQRRPLAEPPLADNGTLFLWQPASVWARAVAPRLPIPHRQSLRPFANRRAIRGTPLQTEGEVVCLCAGIRLNANTRGETCLKCVSPKNIERKGGEPSSRRAKGTYGHPSPREIAPYEPRPENRRRKKGGKPGKRARPPTVSRLYTTDGVFFSPLYRTEVFFNAVERVPEFSSSVDSRRRQHHLRVSGGSVLDIYDETAPVRRTATPRLVRHEQPPFSPPRIRPRYGQVGVCMATSGPGATNTVTGIATAYCDSIPMVIFTGRYPPPHRQRRVPGGGHCGHHTPLHQTQLCGEGRDGSRQGRTAGLLSGPFRAPRPVLVDLPKNVLQGSGRIRLARRREPDAANNPDLPPQFRPDPQGCGRAYNAERPLLFGGGGVTCPMASEEFRNLAKNLSIPVDLFLDGPRRVPL